MIPRLISFRTCPFVKKAELVLRYKGIQYDTEFIDLADPPAWFLRLSPLKKVPVLQIDEDIIFESSVICEYLDEAYPGQLHPDDLIRRAKHRSWIEFGNACLWDAFYLSVKESEEAFLQTRDELHAKFDQIEHALSQGPYFNGEVISLVDLSFVSLFHFLELLHELHAVIFDAEKHPRLQQWKERLLGLDVVKEVYTPDPRALHLEQIGKRRGYLSHFLDAGDFDRNAPKSVY